MKRTGTSLSLSENEMDSDIELDLTLDLRNNQSKTLMPISLSKISIDTIEGQLPLTKSVNLIGESTNHHRSSLETNTKVKQQRGSGFPEQQLHQQRQDPQQNDVENESTNRGQS